VGGRCGLSVSRSLRNHSLRSNVQFGSPTEVPYIVFLSQKIQVCPSTNTVYPAKNGAAGIERRHRVLIDIVVEHRGRRVCDDAIAALGMPLEARRRDVRVIPRIRSSKTPANDVACE
jgi:hypothetical protein